MRRRDVLVGVGRGALGLMLLGAAAACGHGDDEPDPLLAPYQQALADVTLANAAAGTAGKFGTALNQIATERSRHAQVLAQELGRTGAAPTSTTTTTSADAVTQPAPTVDDVYRSLQASAKSAGDLATQQSGYRAGLLGSIAAACSASTVTLPAPKAKS